MKRILITGSNGLVGEHLIAVISEYYENFEVYAVVRTKVNSLTERVNYIIMDLGKKLDVKKFPNKIDVIVHLAQSNKFRDFPGSALDIFNINIQSTAYLLDYGSNAGCQNFIYASSGGVYGCGNGAFTEDTCIDNGSLGYYPASKYSSESLIHGYKSLMNTTILRFFFVYGKRQGETMLLPRLVNNVKTNVVIKLQGNAGIRINPIHVDDAAKAIIKCFDSNEHKIINIAGSETLSLKQICQTIGSILKLEPCFEYEKQKAQDVVGDISIMMEDLVGPKISFIDGVKDIL